MNKIVWSEEFSVGISSIDEQHKQIINTINKLAENPATSVNSETVADVLGEMLRYTDEHLAYEEQLLEQYGYPDFDNHKAKHLDYLEKIGEFSIEVMGYQQDVPEKLLTYLHDWWVNHILHEDMQYRPFFEEMPLVR